ncbi:hypothetical protein H0266_14160 [Halobacillus locisalis]|uniref:Uncharacterized protein n=2 Tax=Halobacillus locisalis TaxID=220753 RepID=A0A838CVE3_9BACI|nr:hypothetical protein [Halobacillus locisalis]
MVTQYRNHIGFQRFTAHAAEMNLMVEADREELEEFEKGGWQISRHNPEHIVRAFSQLRIKDGFKLRGYQFTEGGNGNGIVWALKDDQELPPPEQCPRLEDEFLNPPKPDEAFDDFMVAVEGDRSPLSYLQAAICSHELYEFGAMWHGISWGREQVMGRPDDDFDTEMHDWEMEQDQPDIIEPYFYYNRSGHPVVVYHTTNDIGVITWNRYVHTFSKDDYTAHVDKTVIATAGAGIIF